MDAQSTTGEGSKRRAERRITVHLPMRVRGTDSDGIPFEDLTESENVCRAGAAFHTKRRLNLGVDVDIVIPLPKSPSDFSTRGRIVHIRPGPEAHGLIVGVFFTGPRFHRVFAPETAS